MYTLSKLASNDLVKELPNLNFEYDHIYDTSQLEKQTRKIFKSKNIVSTFIPLELIHMDLFGPTRTTNLGGKEYGFVIIDDFSRFT